MKPYFQAIPYCDPLRVLGYVAEREGTVLLESSALREGCGRYSYLGVDPFLQWVSRREATNPFAELQAAILDFPLTFHDDLPPFQGGIMGYVSYEACHYLESLPRAKHDMMTFPDLAFGFYDVVVAFDHVRQQAWIFSSGYPHQGVAREVHAKQRCEQWVSEIASWVEQPVAASASCNDSDITANFTAETYQQAVARVMDYIREGDIFEANISQCFRAPLPAGLSPLQLYQRLRERNPAPFAAYLQLANTTLVSASPERFLKLTDRHVETRPIKGTRRRGKTPADDAKEAEALQCSEKDRAENIMIVDLLRNDLSRVCENHSVQVPQLCGLESYATVHHLVSVVTGQLQAHYTALDLFCAAFPGGSITGAPKIRAMEIITEMEQAARGPYCGSILYIGFNGDMDSAIVIRTFAIQAGWVTFQAGGAVVLDSDPYAEYVETLTKAQALRQSLVSAKTTEAAV